MKTVKIVPMSAEHLDALASLERICFSRPWSRQMLADELDNQCAAFLVALEPDTDKVIGYAGLLVAADEGYITNVAVDPSRRRQGVAAQLLRVFDDFARANRLAFLTLDITVIFQGNIHLSDYFFRQIFRQFWPGHINICNCFVRQFRSPDQFCQTASGIQRCTFIGFQEFLYLFTGSDISIL